MRGDSPAVAKHLKGASLKVGERVDRCRKKIEAYNKKYHKKDIFSIIASWFGR